MASVYYSIDIARKRFSVEDVAKAASSASTDIELVVVDTNSPSQYDVLLALEAIKAKIIRDGYP